MSPISLSTMMDLLFVVMAVLFVIAIVGFNSMQIVPESKRLVLFRLGRCVGSRGPGIVLSIPIIDRGLLVDIQQTFHYEFRDLSTASGERIFYTVTLDGKIVDAEKSVMNVPNLKDALSKVIETEITDIARSKSHEDLVQRDTWMEDLLKDALSRSSRAWGFEVVKLTVQHG